MKPSIGLIRARYTYNPDTGELVNNGYYCRGRITKIQGIHYPTASIIWAHYYGEWPDTLIDHIDGYHQHNWISNLRKATTRQNSYNAFKYNPNGARGVYDCGRKSKPWQAQIRIDGKKVNLGRFKTKEEAAEAYKQAATEHHGEFAYHD